MKKYINIILISCLLTSCLDALDQAPDGKLSLDEIWADAEMVEQMLNACYNNIPHKGYSYFFWEPLIVSCSDDAWSSEDGVATPVDKMYRDNASAAYHPIRNCDDNPLEQHEGGNNAYWDRFWIQIRLCTQFLEHIDEAAVSSEATRARLKAEAHVLRAFFYMELVKLFGKLPVLEQTLAFDADYSILRRQPVYEVAQLIVSDCDAAIATTELPWRVTVSSDALRVNRALACALKTKAMLFAASPLHNEGSNYWEEAYQIAKKSVQDLKANGYELFTTCTNPSIYGTGGAAALHQLVCEDADIAASPRDRETIYQHIYGHTFVWGIGYIGSGEDGIYKCGSCPTQELVDAFETADGVPVLNLANPYLDERHLQPNYNPANTTYNPNRPYENRDPRFYITVLYHGAQFEWNNGEMKTVNTTYQEGKHSPSFVQTDREHSRTGYYHKKMVRPGSCMTNGIHNANWRYYRFGEVILDYAEAAAEAGHSADALQAVNEIRARSGMPDLPASLPQNELILRIRNERRVELAWEEHRYFDLRRWQSPSGDLSATCKYFTAMIVTQGPNGPVFSRRNILDSPRGGWQNKDLLIPLPLNEANNMEALTGDRWQNPGW